MTASTSNHKMKTDKLPLVTVVICVHNAGDYLRPSVESIINQTYKNLEIIVIDDGSTDNCLLTIQDIKDQRIRILKQSNKGKPAVLNRALKEMSGMFYAIQDADDISCPVRIEKLVNCMLDNPNLAAVYSGHDLIINGNHIAPIFEYKSPLRVTESINRLKSVALDPTGMFRVSLIKDIPYNESLTKAEGIDMVLRIGEKYPMIVLGECLYSYRIHWNSHTRNDSSPIELITQLWETKRQACIRRGLKPLSDIHPKPVRKKRYSNRERDINLSSSFIQSVKCYRRANKRWQAIKVGMLCWHLHPRDIHYLKALFFAVIPLRIIDVIENNKRSSKYDFSI